MHRDEVADSVFHTAYAFADFYDLIDGDGFPGAAWASRPVNLEASSPRVKFAPS